MTDDTLTDAARALLAPWRGPYGGLPPLDRIEPAALELAFRAAVAAKRAEVDAIAADPAPPTFANTVEALEDAGRALGRVLPLQAIASGAATSAERAAAARRLAPLSTRLDDLILQDARLLDRVEAVWRERRSAGLSAEACRLVEVLRSLMRRHGAALDASAKARLAALNVRLVELSAAFRHNLDADAAARAVFVDDEAELEGLNEAQRRAAAAAAASRGRPEAWAVAADRNAVWAVLTHATRRDLRERVWRLWDGRATGDDGGPDNAPLIAEMLALRGEKARLLGFSSYAEFALDDRMVRDPDAVEALLEATWTRVLPAARAQLAAYQAIANRDGVHAPLAPWDRQFYAEKYRRDRFGVDGDALAAHLPLDRVIEAMFWNAGRVHGLAFERIADAPVVHPSCRVYGVTRAGGEPAGVLYLDLFARPGKSHGSYQHELRAAEHFRGRVLPIASIHSSFPAPPDDAAPVLLPWEYANVFFHEFGHALHMLSSHAAYPSLGSVRVAWDFVELPALLNERWLIERETMARFGRHHRSGAPMPASLLDRLEAALRHDRIFSLNLDYLLPAIVDLRLHRLADGSGTPIDPVQVERATAAELGLPEAWDLIMRVQQSVHSFAGAYAAGVYVYLWADVMAADVADAFAAAPGGLYDADVAERWRKRVLGVGATVPADEAFRAFRGRDPAPSALWSRFGLAAAP